MSHNEARDQRRGGRGTVEARRGRRMQPTVLALEPRNLLSHMHMPFNLPTGGPPAGSTINITGTTAGTIVVYQGNGNDDSVTITSSANIVVDIGNGNGDSVTIDETGSGTVTVITGHGSGTVSITTTGPTPNVSRGSSGWSYYLNGQEQS